MRNMTKHLTGPELRLVHKCNSYFKTTPGAKFGEILEDYMKLFDLEQEDLAGDYQVAVSSIERWINGESEPHIKIREKIVLSIKHEVI